MGEWRAGAGFKYSTWLPAAALSAQPMAPKFHLGVSQPLRVVDLEVLGDIEVGKSAGEPRMKPKWASDGLKQSRTMPPKLVSTDLPRV